MFTPSNMLVKYLNASPKDIYDIIGALIGYINADPGFKTNDFDEAVRYVLDHDITREQLFSPFDASKPLVSDKAKWDEEYYSFARVYLKNNFCPERIQHIKAVGKYVYSSGNIGNKNKTSTISINKSELGHNENTPPYYLNENNSSSKKAKGRHQLPNRRIKVIAILIVVLVIMALVLAFISVKSSKRKQSVQIPTDQSEISMDQQNVRIQNNTVKQLK